MSKHFFQTRNRTWILGGLGSALLIAVFLSPFASQNPDGLDRVSEDLKFSQKASPVQPAYRLPFYQVFDSYAVRGVPEYLATPLAGLAGTLFTFGVAWGVGKLAIRNPAQQEDRPSSLE
jgi:cobalt/nickel transport protein